MDDLTKQIRLIKYSILQISVIPLIICDIFYWKKEILQSPHKHAVLCVLTVSFIQKMLEVRVRRVSLKRNDSKPIIRRFVLAKGTHQVCSES